MLPLLACLPALILAVSPPEYGPDADATIDRINECFSNSVVMRLDAQERLRIKTPDGFVTIPLRGVTFAVGKGYEAGKVRVLGEYVLDSREGDQDKSIHRIAFTCRDGRRAEEAVRAFRALQASRGATPRPGPGSEAVETVNQALQNSVLLPLTTKGQLVFNTPDGLCRVDLRTARFTPDDNASYTGLRIYGGRFLEVENAKGKRQEATRVDFVTEGRSARSAAQALRQIQRSQGFAPADPPAALRQLNASLSNSVVLGVDARGVATINAPDYFYTVDLRQAQFRAVAPETRYENRLLGLVRSVSTTGSYGVEIEGRSGFTRQAPGEAPRAIRRETFQCGNARDARDAVQAFHALKQGTR